MMKGTRIFTSISSAEPKPGLIELRHHRKGDGSEVHDTPRAGAMLAPAANAQERVFALPFFCFIWGNNA